MKTDLTVYVHAWEYVNPGPDASGAGFNWYYNSDIARQMYDEDVADPTCGGEDWAQFLFTVDIPAPERCRVTDYIGDRLPDLCAKAETRRVGAAVQQYWDDSLK